jgi:hypothetical protein
VNVASAAAFLATPVPVPSPESVILGDVNANGVLDLIVASFSSVSVFLGTGTGAFGAGSPLPTAFGSYRVRAGDLNGDGKLDLAVLNLFGNNVEIMLGNGAGTFAAAPGSPLAVGTSPQSLAVGDLNADGRLDLAVGTAGSQGPFSGVVSILLGNGLGGFTNAPGSPIAVNGEPAALATGDTNNDGRLDLAFTGFGTLSLLVGNGLGGFVPGPAVDPLSTAVNVELGDLNGDGRADLVLGTYGGVVIMLGDAAGGFASAPGSPIFNGTQNYVAIGDLNGNGVPDLAVANAALPASGKVSVLLGNGAGGFAAAAGSPISTGTDSNQVAVGDLNGDGRLDLVVGNSGSANVSVLLNQP